MKYSSFDPGAGHDELRAEPPNSVANRRAAVHLLGDDLRRAGQC